MNICIFQTGEPLHIDSGNYRPMRSMLLADKLVESGHKVVLISSSFFHQRKSFRSKGYKSIHINENLEIKLIPSIGYKKHISLKRLLDHIILAINLHIFLSNNKSFKPDKIFLGYPPIETSYIIIKWASKYNIPIILDVKDDWPQTFIEPFPESLKPFIRLLLSPYFILSKFIFRNSDKITSITDDFINWIKLFSNDIGTESYYNKRYFISPLVRKPIELSEYNLRNSINFWERKNINLLESRYFSFVGSFSKSFDFNFIYRLATIIEDKYPKINFIICGSGDQYLNVKKLFSGRRNIMVFGEINKYQASFLTRNSIATLAPYLKSDNFQRSIPNKVIESLENGVPFITNLDGSLRRMILNKNNGIYIPDNNYDQIINYFNFLDDPDLLNELKSNAIKSYKELFDYDLTYNNIIKNLINS
tara:strand:+ start:10665 stop:11924 length:1260 start_codon:yes stop_codon:yes gene_type:complete